MKSLNVNLDTLRDCIRDVDELDTEMWESIGPSLTCCEADALHGLLVCLGLHDHADRLMDAHAEGDDEGDAHYRKQNETENL